MTTRVNTWAPRWMVGVYSLAAAAMWIAFPARFISDDSYFYAVAARRLALGEGQTFSGLFPTNGVHPLHFYLLSGWSFLIAQVDESWLWSPRYGLPYAFALIGFAVWQLWHAERELGLQPASLVLPTLGFTTAFGLYFSEVHVLYASLALWLRVGATKDWLASGRMASLSGLIHAAVMLARLDALFLSALSLLLIAWRGRRRLREVAIMLSAFLLPVGAYLVSNVIVFGGALPVSGWLKSTFPVPTFDGLTRIGPIYALQWLLSDYNIAFGVVPVLASLFLLPRILGGLPPRHRDLSLAAVGGAAAHMSYTMAFADWCGWFWYYLLPVFAGSLTLSLALARLRPSGTGRSALCWLPTLLFSGVLATKLVPGDMTSQTSLDFVRERGIDDSTILVTECPGIIAFYTRNRIVAADMLTSSQLFYREMVASSDAFQFLFDHARALGYPYEYLIFRAGVFVDFDRQRGELLYRDPRRRDPRISADGPVIGRLAVGAPIYDVPEKGITVWKLDR